MYALVSLLDKKHSAEVKAIWDELECECGLRGVQAVPFPHFPWFLAVGVKQNELELRIKELATTFKPFTVTTSGIALFTGPKPVLILPIVRTAALSSLHAHVWESLHGTVIDIDPNYQASNWMPYISLAYPDVGPENINCAIQRLAFRTFRWTITIDNLSLLASLGADQAALEFRVDL